VFCVLSNKTRFNNNNNKEETGNDSQNLMRETDRDGDTQILKTESERRINLKNLETGNTRESLPALEDRNGKLAA
jgi:cytochrome b involved in lipid metabolism